MSLERATLRAKKISNKGLEINRKASLKLRVNLKEKFINNLGSLNSWEMFGFINFSKGLVISDLYICLLFIYWA